MENIRKRKRVETSSQVSTPDSEVGPSTSRAGLVGSQVDISKLPPAPFPFKWTTSRVLSLLFAMIGKIPVGRYKDQIILDIHRELCESLKMIVPIIEVYRVLFGIWNIHLADTAKFRRILEKRGNVLLNTKDWTKFIAEKKVKMGEGTPEFETLFGSASEASTSGARKALTRIVRKASRGTARKVSTSTASKASTSTASKASTSTASKASTSAARKASTSTASKASTSAAKKASTSAARKASTSAARKASTSTASQASTSTASQAASSSASQAATIRRVRPARRITLEEFNKRKILKVKLNRMDNMLSKVQLDMLSRYQAGSSKTNLEDAFSNINIDVGNKQAQTNVKDDASLDSTMTKKF